MSNRSISLTDSLYRSMNEVTSHQDERVDLSLLPVGDGLTLARKR